MIVEGFHSIFCIILRRSERNFHEKRSATDRLFHYKESKARKLGFQTEEITIKGRTIRKVMGGGGEKTKKIHARENVKKKNSCKEEGKEKKFVQKEGPTPAPAI